MDNGTMDKGAMDKGTAPGTAGRTRRDTEGSLQHVVSFVLRSGVLLAGGTGFLALIFNLVRHAGERVAYTEFTGTPEPERHVPSILEGALHLQSRSLMMMAILLLVLTPIVRVIVSLAGFIKERDRVYIAVTTVVLITLLLSLAFGGATE